MQNQDYIQKEVDLDTITGIWIKATDKAELVDVGGEEVWFPKSQCTFHRKPSEGTVEVEAPVWLLEAKRLV